VGVFPCDEYAHAAVVRVNYLDPTGGDYTLEWVETPDKVHFAEEALANNGGREFAETKYRLSPAASRDACTVI
jgi:hypothetical protein